MSIVQTGQAESTADPKLSVPMPVVVGHSMPLCVIKCSCLIAITYFTQIYQ